MEEESIEVNGQNFNDWLERMRQEITSMKDNLALLETEGRRLSGIWEGGAGEKWEMELQKALRRALNCAAQMEALAGKAENKAQALARMEKIMLQAAGEL